MSTLHDTLGEFAHRLRTFSARATEDVEKLQKLQRGQGSSHCVGASTFREACQDLDRQTAALTAEVVHLEGATLEAVSLEELLGHCLAVFQLNQRSVARVQAHLKDFGLAAACPSAEEPGEGGGQGSTPAAEEGRPEEGVGKQQGNGSQPQLGGKGGDPPGDQQRNALRPAISAPPTTASTDTDSPAFRDLQRKYGALGLSSSQDPPSWRGPGRQDTPAGPPGQPPPALPSTSTACRAPGARPAQPGQQSLDSCLTPWDAGRPTGAPGQPEAPTPLSPGHSRRASRQGSAMARLAAGDPPWDMLSLKAAINSAQPGTGEILRIITSASFQPQAAAFTALLHMCAKAKLWQKALEVFEAMGKVQPRVVPNTVHFSSLISACATAGRWEEASHVFAQMKALAQTHPDCQPNVITFSALMTACCSAGRPEKALEVFHEMRADGIQPDHICFSTLIAGFERSGDLAAAQQLKAEMVMAGVAAKPSGATPTQRTGRPGAPGQQHQLCSPFSSAAEAAPGLTGRQALGLQPLTGLQLGGSVGHARLANGYASCGPSATSSPRGHLNFLAAQLHPLRRSSETIPAHYGGHGVDGQDVQRNYSGGLEESTLDLRKELLHTKSPLPSHLASQQLAAALHAAASRQGSPFGTPPAAKVLDASGPRTPSTAELLWAAQAQAQQPCQASGTAQPGARSLVAGQALAAQPISTSHQRLLQQLSGSASLPCSFTGLDGQHSLSPAMSQQEPDFSLFDRAPGPFASTRAGAQSSGHCSPLAPQSPVRHLSPQASAAPIGTTDDAAKRPAALQLSSLGPHATLSQGELALRRRSSSFGSPRPAAQQLGAAPGAGQHSQSSLQLPPGQEPQQSTAHSGVGGCSQPEAQAAPLEAPVKAPRTISQEEHARLPLRLSRELCLADLNAAYLATYQLLATGAQGAVSGLTREDVEEHLGQRQALAVLQSLLQLDRLVLTVQNGQRLYQMC